MLLTGAQRLTFTVRLKRLSGYQGPKRIVAALYSLIKLSQADSRGNNESVASHLIIPSLTFTLRRPLCVQKFDFHTRQKTLCLNFFGGGCLIQTCGIHLHGHGDISGPSVVAGLRGCPEARPPGSVQTVPVELFSVSFQNWSARLHWYFKQLS